ncbi:hypothetical protein Sjap_005597 [Stephania japonica]|uniref:Uncharacterized protein n=1 Tax=Stephania japonica TaxID=461633 RepID=A0AAP0K5U3_9MAGN
MASLLVSDTGPMIHTHPIQSLSHLDSISHQKPTTLSFQSPKPNNCSVKNTPHFINQPDLSLLNGPVDSTMYALLLESCNCPNLGTQIHAHTVKNGFTGHEFVETKLMQMYGNCCGNIENASLVFDKMRQRNLYSWAGYISVCVDHGCYEEAILMFLKLLLEEIWLNFFVFPVLFKACSGLVAFDFGRQVHGLVIKSRFVNNVYVGNSLIDMYGKCGCFDDAKKVLSEMPVRDCVSWNSVITGCTTNGLVFEAFDLLKNMELLGNLKPNIVSWSAVIGGFAQNGFDREALEVFYKMQESGIKPNARTLASLLPACARLQALRLGKQIHGYITRHGFMSNPFVVNGLVDVYRRCSDMKSALKMFERFSARNSVSYNTMIVGYSENGEVNKAKEFFDQMEFVGVGRDSISWNAMISGYVENELFNEALEMFRDLMFQGDTEADSYTLGSAVTACANLSDLNLGKEIHSYAIVNGLHSNPFVGGSLVELYCKCKELDAAQKAFNEVIDKDTATWNALISGYARCDRMEDIHKPLVKMKEYGLEPSIYTWNGIIAGCVEIGKYELALQKFSELTTSDLMPDIYTVCTTIAACSRLAAVRQGKQIHAHSVRLGYDRETQAGSSLVDMYAKCGSINLAWRAFKRISQPNLVSWNAMVSGYAMHGHGREGISIFQKMLVEGIKPDVVTFVSLLSSCVHSGLVDFGLECFDLMKLYDIEPTIKHYTCVVDLLSRAGRLREAYEIVERMEVQPDPALWGALLGGCVIHRNFELGKIAAQKLMELEPDNTGNYILYANLSASTGRWEDLATTRQLIKDEGMHKSPGCSWIEGKDQIHVFLSCDRSHRQTDEIYAVLHSLTANIRKDVILAPN